MILDPLLVMRSIANSLEQPPHNSQVVLPWPGLLGAGKPVSNTDLVVWVTMGLQHVPRSEDIPLIYNLYASFLIKPWNYFDRQEALYAGTFDGVKNQGCMPPARGEAAYHWII